MVGQRGLPHVQPVDQFAGAQLSALQKFDDPKPAFVAESFESLGLFRVFVQVKHLTYQKVSIYRIPYRSILVNMR